MPSKKIRKGMILAAGLGTRLRPVTLDQPKPLVPVLNIANLMYNVFLLKQAGVEEIVINLHHLGNKIKSFFETQDLGIRFSFTQEDILLGTGGGVKNAEKLLQGEPFILANCDFITDLDLKPIIEQHFKRKSLATMVLLDDPMMQSFYSPVGVDQDNHLCSLPSLEVRVPKRTGIFTGIHVLDPSVFEHLLSKPSGINQTLYPALMKQSPERIFGHFTDSFWFDTGDLYFLWLTSMQLLERLNEKKHQYTATLLETLGGYTETQPGVWLADKASIPKNCTLSAPVVIGKNCKIGKGASIGPFAVLGDESEVGEGARLKRYVALPKSKVSAHSNFEGGMLYEDRMLPTKKLS